VNFHQSRRLILKAGAPKPFKKHSAESEVNKSSFVGSRVIQNNSFVKIRNLLLVSGKLVFQLSKAN
jgi:hypothetical protein